MILRELFNSKKLVLREGIDHPEDLIISNGTKGAQQVVQQLASLQKNADTVTVKWDGFPAVVFGRDKTGELVFTDKHMYDKVAKGKMDFMTIRAYDEQRGSNRTNLWEQEAILRPALERIVPSGKDFYYMGDLMWTGTPTTSDGFFVFKPNTVEYRVSIEGELGQNISRSVGGIAVHTYIPGLGQGDTPLTGLKGLKENQGITFLVGEMRDKPKVSVDPALVKRTQQIIASHGPAVDKFIAALTEMKGKSVITAMGPFITSMLADNDISNDIVPRFLEFLKGRLTPAAAEKMLGKQQDGWLYQEDGGGPGLLGIWTMWAAVTELKLHIKEQIDTQQQGSEVIAVTDGVNAHEGYVFGGGKDKLKLIDRLGFSRANFAKHKVDPTEIEAKKNGPMAAFCFGRMNPPTLGHKLVMEKTISVGGANSFIFLSNSAGTEDDPLNPAVKAAFIKQIYPAFAKHIVSDPVQGPIYAANWLYDKGFRNMTFIGGSDRLGKGAGSIEKLLNSWNSGPVRTTDNARGPNGREYVHLQFVSSGERDADAPGVQGISGSLARKYAKEGNEQGFQQATGVNANIKVNGKTLYQATREGMGIRDQNVAEGWKEKVGAAALAGAMATGAGAKTPKVPLQHAIDNATIVYNNNKFIKKEIKKYKEKEGEKRKAAPPKEQGVNEKMMPASMFAGSKKNKLGSAGQWKNTGPSKNRPARQGDLVGGAEESYDGGSYAINKPGYDGESNYTAQPNWRGHNIGEGKQVPLSEDVETAMANAMFKLFERAVK